MRLGAIFYLFLSNVLWAAESYHVEYFQKTFGHIHATPFAYAASKTTIQCGQPIKVFEKAPPGLVKGWSYSKAGEDVGYLQSSYLSQQRPTDCKQQKYPTFFQALNLDLSDLYYWGRLYDHAIEFTTGSWTPQASDPSFFSPFIDECCRNAS